MAAFNLGDLATSVLDHVDSQRLVKTSAVSYTLEQFQTSVGQEMLKLAEAVRAEADDSITNEDLAKFRATYAT